MKDLMDFLPFIGFIATGIGTFFALKILVVKNDTEHDARLRAIEYKPQTDFRQLLTEAFANHSALQEERFNSLKRELHTKGENAEKIERAVLEGLRNLDGKFERLRESLLSHESKLLSLEKADTKIEADLKEIREEMKAVTSSFGMSLDRHSKAINRMIDNK